MIPRHEPPLVLVADDELHARMMLRMIFERAGFQVVDASDGMQALAQTRALLPDLILLDVMMPNLNGFDVLRQLRQEEETARIPTIMLTAMRPEPANLEKGLNLGADDFLFKPFQPQELLARAQSKMRARQLEDALFRRSRDLEALLVMSARLNQHADIHQLAQTILTAALQVLPSDLAILAYSDAFGGAHQQSAPAADDGKRDDFSLMLDVYAASDQVKGFAVSGQYGIGIRLRYGENHLGRLLLQRRGEAYDDSHRALLAGIAQQAGLALHNACLYAQQIRYTQDLEITVERKVAELESTRQRLARAERLASIGRLAASIAHEINNPLMPIKLLLESLNEEWQHNQTYDPQVTAEIQAQVERIRRLVRRLLEFGRDRQLALQPVNIRDLLQETLELNRKLLQAARIRVETHLPNLPLVYGARDQLESVFVNLIQNAHDAIGEDGTLTVTAYLEAQQVVIEFSDSGIGMSDEVRERIFDEFFTTKEQGTGIGLYVSNEVVRGHQGSIEVRSAVGQGTTFTVRLPAYREDST